MSPPYVKYIIVRLEVPNRNPLTQQLFDKSVWVGAPGAGVWSGALRQGPPDLQQPGQTRINGVKSRATLISLNRLYGPDGIMRTTHDAPSVSPTQTKVREARES